MKLAMDSAATDEIAARWFCKCDSGDWTDADQAQLDAWLQSSTANRIAYLRLNAGWKKSARLKALGAGIPEGVIPAKGVWGDTRFSGGSSTSSGPVQKDTREPFKRRWPAWVAGTSFVILAASYLIWALAPTGQRYSTPVGGQDTVPLADGSQIILNTDTRIRVALSQTERRIELDQGEAFFKVAKDSSRPFVVSAGDKRVVAVGTEFSVRRSGDEVKVAVAEGKVRIGSRFLAAGAIATTEHNNVRVWEGAVAETEQALSWRKGFLVFDATPLADAVAEFNRYNERQIVIGDPAIAGFRIGGNFRSSNTDAFLWLIQTGFHVKVEREADRIVLTQ
jgi:transmembrane sensor